ncbi:hypothetical protein ABEB36_002642 [Hypothenemus hampei]|uniref:Uncharacterized protein n=1 Tax=Hypothenemus hampei TaxID=57062 RepID=A0ABD1F6H6_HYPHA
MNFFVLVLLILLFSFWSSSTPVPLNNNPESKEWFEHKKCHAKEGTNQEVDPTKRHVFTTAKESTTRTTKVKIDKEIHRAKRYESENFSSLRNTTKPGNHSSEVSEDIVPKTVTVLKRVMRDIFQIEPQKPPMAHETVQNVTIKDESESKNVTAIHKEDHGNEINLKLKKSAINDDGNNFSESIFMQQFPRCQREHLDDEDRLLYKPQRNITVTKQNLPKERKNVDSSGDKERQAKANNARESMGTKSPPHHRRKRSKPIEKKTEVESSSTIPQPNLFRKLMAIGNDNKEESNTLTVDSTEYIPLENWNLETVPDFSTGTDFFNNEKQLILNDFNELSCTCVTHIEKTFTFITYHLHRPLVSEAYQENQDDLLCFNRCYLTAKENFSSKFLCEHLDHLPTQVFENKAFLCRQLIEDPKITSEKPEVVIERVAFWSKLNFYSDFVIIVLQIAALAVFLIWAFFDKCYKRTFVAYSALK